MMRRMCAVPEPNEPLPLGRRLLAIDPGLQRTGYAVLSASPRGAHLLEAGLIRLPPRRPLAERLHELERGIEQVIDTYAPATLACEDLYSHYAHPRTAVLMAHARGVVLVVAARRGLSILGIAATNAKKMLTGNGHASKQQVQRAVAATLRLAAPPQPHDVADAIAIGLAALRRGAAAERVAIRGAAIQPARGAVS